MPELAGPARRTRVQLAADDEPGTDPLGQQEVEHRLGPGACPGVGLGERAEVGVVADPDGQPGAPIEPFGDVDLVPVAEHRGRPERLRGQQDGRRRRDPDAEQLAVLEPLAVGQLEHRAPDVLERLGGAVVDVEVLAALGQHGAVGAGQHDARAPVPEVHPDEDSEARGQAQPGGRATTRARPAGVVALDQDTVRDQLGHGARDGRDGQAGPRGDVAPRDGARGADGGHDRGAIAPAAVVHAGTLAPTFSFSG